MKPETRNKEQQMNLSQRSTLPELMDDPDLSQEALHGTLVDISKCNRWLGGDRITLNALQNHIKAHPEKKHWIIADVGCGDGQQLRYIADTFKNESIELELIGIDINNESITLGRQRSVKYTNIRFEATDLFDLRAETFPCDIIINTLTLHHLSDDEIPAFVKQCAHLARVSVIINDLQRSPLAYRLFQLFSSIFIQSPVAKYDGLISIRRGFRKTDFMRFSKQLVSKHHRISWKWAFRYLWVIKTL